MSPFERGLLWFAALVALLSVLLAGYNFVAGRELTDWAEQDLQKWVVHTTGEVAHAAGPPIDHQPPPPPPPW